MSLHILAHLQDSQERKHCDTLPSYGIELQIGIFCAALERSTCLRRASRMALPRTSAQQAFLWRWGLHQAP